MVVRDYLIRHFKMDDTRLKKMGIGKSEALVEIIVYPPGTQIASRNPHD